MIAECVGLDLGQTAIKAVRFRRRLSGRESVEYFHLPCPMASRSGGTGSSCRTAPKFLVAKRALWER